MRATVLVAPLVLAALAGCVYAPFDLSVPPSKFEEETLLEADTDAKLLLVRIDGEISDQPGREGLFGSSESTTASVKESLELAKKDANVKGLILRIDSPGGGVTASDIVYHEVLDWKRETKKPVVAIFMDVAASGGYYIAQSADEIIAHPSGITGSIGVIAMLLNVKGLGEKIGVEMNVFKSGELKDMGNPFRAMDTKEKVVFQKLIDDMYQKFVGVVAEGRKRAGLSREDVLKLADGRVYTAEDARAVRLVDRTGYFEDAVKDAKALAKVDEARVVTYAHRGFLSSGQRTIYSHAQAEAVPGGLLRAQTETNLVKLDARGLLPARERPVFNYLWIPGN